MPRFPRDHPGMPDKNISQSFQIVAANLEALRARYPALNSQAAIGRAAKVDQKTVGRILNLTNEPSLEVLAKIAKVFDLEAWQLMVPGLDVAKPQRLISAQDAELYDKLREVVAQQSAQVHAKTSPSPAKALAERLNQHKDFGTPYHPKEETDAERDHRKKKGK